jgi:hypothetical protein
VYFSAFFSAHSKTGVLQSILQHPLTILPQAKWSPAGGFIHSLSLVQRKKGLKADSFPPSLLSVYSNSDGLQQRPLFFNVRFSRFGAQNALQYSA